jgi:hypothetical protein
MLRLMVPVPEGAPELELVDEVVVEAAVGAAAHGPVGATGDLAAGFEWVSGHGCQVLSSTLSVDRYGAGYGCFCMDRSD